MKCTETTVMRIDYDSCMCIWLKWVLHEPPHRIPAPLLQHRPKHKVDLHNTHKKENTRNPRDKTRPRRMQQEET
jgi:hypothetical protein